MAVGSAGFGEGCAWSASGRSTARKLSLIFIMVQLTAAMAFLLLATIRGKNSVSEVGVAILKVLELCSCRFAGNGSGVPVLAASAMVAATREAARRSLAAR